MFNLPKRCTKVNKTFVCEIPEKHNVRVIAGAEVYMSLCPINPLTHSREPLTEQIMGVLNDPNKSALVSQVVRMLPAIASDSRLSDDDKLDMCFDRFEVGTRSENMELYNRLTPIMQNAFKSLSPDDSVDKSVDKTIDFKPADSPASE